MRRVSSPRAVVLGVGLLAALGGCGAPTPATPPDAGAWFDEALGPCRLGGALPHTVDDVLARVNALPKPLGVACFLASLPRPLAVVATSSRFSAQPAGGPEDPRLFLFTAGALLSVVPDGPGRELLEVGELVTTSRTLKAELVFPITGPVTRDAAYTHLEYSPTLTSCGLCHGAEEPHPAHPLARVSVALRPPARTLVPLERARAFAEACDPGTQRERCLRWAGVFGFGEVVEANFPPAFADFIR